MEFCSECGTMLVPKKDKSEVLVCPDCGNEEKLDSERDYQIKEEKKKGKEPGVAVVEESKEKRIREQEYDIDDDVMEDVFEETY